MREKNYFSHDYHSRDHLRDVRKDWGLAGYGFYWCLVEILHEQGGFIKETELESIAYDLRAEENMAHDIVYKYGMFQVKKGKIYSSRVIENLQKREELSKKRTAAAESRWGKEHESEPPAPADDDTQEMPAIFYHAFNPDIPEDITDEERRELVKQYYIEQIERRFNEYLESLDLDELSQRNIYDYKNLFDTIINEVKTKQYVVINRKQIPVWQYLQVLGSHIKKNGTIANLDQAVRDVEKRYTEGKVKNKANYLIAALYNAAVLDCGTV
ncbi:MAG: DUF4373 domain-containing protein [Ruminococcus flavefaciens]|nr:DUF4373 domain-containing protein [Ruminococcus flavefaciens]